jgi:hydrogenase maturation protease
MKAIEDTVGIMVVGVGNVLLRDDGLGVHVIRELQKDPPPGVGLIDAGTATLHAVSLIEGADRVLVIDAVRAGRAPGTIYLFDGRTIPLAATPVSLHSLGLCSAIRLLPEGLQPREVRVLGMEPAIIGYGMDLSREVMDALPGMVGAVCRMVGYWAGMRLNRDEEPPADEILDEAAVVAAGET